MIDTSFDFRSEVSGDPDSKSPTLRSYHQLLWSKPLPGGEVFDLQQAGHKGTYHLRYAGDSGVMKLSSDTITTRLGNRARKVIAQIPEEDLPPYPGYTIGSAILFPRTSRSGSQTINQARGRHPRIADRFDLTLECIRRHYLGEASPLAPTLATYSDFFDLFVDFSGYVEFWLLQDLIDPDGGVSFWLPSTDFTEPAVPQTVDEYLSYLQHRQEFISARNRRISNEMDNRSSIP